MREDTPFNRAVNKQRHKRPEVSPMWLPCYMAVGCIVIKLDTYSQNEFLEAPPQMARNSPSEIEFEAHKTRMHFGTQ